MKFRITQRDARNWYKLYRIDIDLMEIFKNYAYPQVAYHAGVYGWNADILINGSVGLENGYRPIAKKQVEKDLQNNIYKKCRKIADSKIKFDTKHKKIKKLFDELCDELRNN